MHYIAKLDDLAEKYSNLHYYIPTLQYKLTYIAPIHNCKTCNKYYYNRHGIRCEKCDEWVCSNCIRCKNENDTNILSAIDALYGIESMNEEEIERKIDTLNELLCDAYDGFYCETCFKTLYK